MEIQQALADIWSVNDIRLPSFIYERSYSYCVNEEQKDILVLGLNPSYTAESKPVATRYSMTNHKDKEYTYHPYFTRVRRMLQYKMFEVDLNEERAYADLFYYRTVEDIEHINELLGTLDGRIFLEAQLKITQELIEDVIQPKVIIVNSWNAAMFLGIYEERADSAWLGYALELIEQTASGYKVYQIRGIGDDFARSNEFRTTTNLKGTYVIVFPYLRTGLIGDNKSLLQAWEIQFYLESSKKLGQKAKKAAEYEVDPEIMCRFPFLYMNIKESRKKNLERCESQILVDELISFRSKSVTEVATTIFNKLIDYELLTVKDVDLLSDKAFCETMFEVEKPLVCNLPNTERFDDAYFSDVLKVKSKRFVLNKKLPEEIREDLEDWYLEKMTVEEE